MDKLVQEIHDAFNGASDALLVEAQETIEKLKDKEWTHPNEEVAQRLRKFGFNKSKKAASVESHEKQQQKIKERRGELERTSKLIVEKNRIDPVHKFITDKKVTEICEKYNLVHGASDKYMGDIPLRNLEEMEAFKIADEDKRYILSLNIFNVESTMYSVYYTVNEKASRRAVELYDDLVSEYGGRWDKNNWVVDHDFASKHNVEELEPGEASIYEEEKYSICAPLKDFDTEGMEVRGRKLLKKPVPDPIVLFKVSGGYRIVTAWGPEASDPEVINPINN